MNEWKPIPQWPMYAFNGVDTVRSLPRVVYKSDGTHQTYKERILKWKTGRDGRLSVILADTTNGRLQHFRLYQLVWMYHNDQPIPSDCEIHHLDGNFRNNDIENLQLLTTKEHRELHGLAEKTVQALDADGNVAFEFPSTWEARRQGFDQSAVSASCRGCLSRQGNHIYKGYHWQYA